jgi:hypothetical protein
LCKINKGCFLEIYYDPSYNAINRLWKHSAARTEKTLVVFALHGQTVKIINREGIPTNKMLRAQTAEFLEKLNVVFN